MLLVACIFSCFAKPPVHVKAAEEAMKAFNATYAAQYHLEPLQQTGLFEKNVGALFLDYQIHEPLTEKQAEQLLQELSQTFLAFVNKREELQPHLAVHPFTEKEISLSIHTPLLLVKEEALASAEISGNTITYYYKLGISVVAVADNSSSTLSP